MKCVFLLFLVFFSHLANAEDRRVASLFSTEGVEGTIVLKSLRSDKTITHNDERASHKFSPASSFKVLNTLIAVQEGVASTSGTAFKWNGKTHDFPDWNKDQTLASAFKVSCVWCYQEIAKRVGADAYKRYIALAKYGTLAETFDTTTFWLDGSLTVSAIEQVTLLKRIYQRELPFRDDAYNSLKDVMLAEQTDRYRLYAKTGWAARMTPQIGWYIGYIETTDDVWFFATNVVLRSEADLGVRQKLTRAVLQMEGIIP
ncbi:MAG: class D beta-lactamase [Candidatus Accumulibacter sp. UW20]|jgi:beta-lactamase class D